MERATFLTGEFRHALDDRGRVAVPVRFRPRWGGGDAGQVAGRPPAIFPGPEWDESAFEPPPPQRASSRVRALHALRGRSTWSSTARGVLVPSYLREYASIQSGEVVVVGALSRREPWSPARWNPYRSQIEEQPEALAEHLADLGI